MFCSQFDINLAPIPLTNKVADQYLPVIPEPLDCDVLKAYLDILRDTTGNLCFSHPDEQVYAKVLRIIRYHVDCNHKKWYTYEAHFEGGGGGVRQKWDVIGRREVGGGGGRGG